MTATPRAPVALGWATRVSVLAAAYRAEGLRPAAAFRRALEACRDPALPVVPDETPARRSKSALDRVLGWLRTQSEPRSASDVRAATGITRTGDTSTALRELEAAGLVREAGKRKGDRGRSMTLWEVVP